MRDARKGEVWLVDMGMVAKVRPCLLLTDYPADDELALAASGSALDLILYQERLVR